MKRNKIGFYEILTSISYWSVIFLIFFLPFSSWLVSYTGILGISILRDLFAFIIFLIGLILLCRNKKYDSVIIVAIVFTIYGLATFFWKEASAMQWLKGWRFLYGPVLLLIGLKLSDFDQKKTEIFQKVITAIGIITIIISSADIVGINLPLISEYSSVGVLMGNNYVGLAMVKRLQGLMSGPNALGLYLLSIYAFSLACSYKSKRSYLIITLAVITAFFIILTFSRGCLIALFIMTLFFFYQKIVKKWGVSKSLIVISLLALTIVTGSYFLYKNGVGEQFFTHNASSSLRAEQYQRIWQQKGEIGLFGRGTGTAGPSSQNRIDEGENHWTENIYLDIFEELGLVGLAIFIGLLATMLIASYNNREEYFAKASFYAIVSFISAGLFLNIYTGQAGWWLAMIFFGLMQKGKR